MLDSKHQIEQQYNHKTVQSEMVADSSWPSVAGAGPAGTHRRKGGRGGRETPCPGGRGGAGGLLQPSPRRSVGRVAVEVAPRLPPCRSAGARGGRAQAAEAVAALQGRSAAGRRGSRGPRLRCPVGGRARLQRQAARLQRQGRRGRAQRQAGSRGSGRRLGVRARAAAQERPRLRSALRRSRSRSGGRDSGDRLTGRSSRRAALRLR
jgi:hypothetical protein